MAGFFTNKTTFAYTCQVVNQGKFYNASRIDVHPSGKVQYTKPVYLLMTDISRSAAEGFVLAMKPLPHVTQVGTNTMGIQSGMLGKSIGNFYCTVSNVRFSQSQRQILRSDWHTAGCSHDGHHKRKHF